MANFIRELNKNASKYVNASSRYRYSKVIQYTEHGFLAFKTYKKHNIGFHPDDKWFDITEDFEYRPDLASFEFYGTSDFWWRIMEANHMKDILEFKTGVNIRLPGSLFK